jgi:hypothetical protein
MTVPQKTSADAGGVVVAPAWAIISAAAAAAAARLMACAGPVRRRGCVGRPVRVGWESRAARASR